MRTGIVIATRIEDSIESQGGVGGVTDPVDLEREITLSMVAKLKPCI